MHPVFMPPPSVRFSLPRAGEMPGSAAPKYGGIVEKCANQPGMDPCFTSQLAAVLYFVTQLPPLGRVIHDAP